MVNNGLPLEFIGRGESAGDIFVQKLVSPQGFLYERTLDNGFICYEVFKAVKLNTCNKIEGVKNFFRYPTATVFGKWAWSYTNLDKAIDKLRSFSKGGQND